MKKVTILLGITLMLACSGTDPKILLVDPAWAWTSSLTAAAIQEGRVPAALATERRARLMELQQGISLARNRRLVGQTLKVLVDQQSAAKRFAGRTMADAPEVDNRVHFECAGKAAAIWAQGVVPVRITRAEAYDLWGTAAPPA